MTTTTGLLIDPRRTWRLAEERLAAESDEATRRNLETVITHMKAEAALDFEALMGTVSPDAHYKFWSRDGTMELVGKEQVEAYYSQIASTGMHRIEHTVDRLVADPHSVVTEGRLRIAYPGQLLSERVKGEIDPDQLYLFETQMLIVWPMQDGLVVGEDSYSGADGFAGIEDRPVDLSQIFDYAQSIA